MLTHPSFVEERSRSYERLEFLGDSVLELAIARGLYERYPEATEGDLTRLRATVVSRASCASVGRRLGLDALLCEAASGRAPDEELARLAATRSVLAALLEALLGALYLTYGLERIRAAIVEAFDEELEAALTENPDAKTALQEALAREGRTVSYRLLESSGPPHDRHFTCAAVIDGAVAGVGAGRSKKAAEQEAAREVLTRLGA